MRGPWANCAATPRRVLGSGLAHLKSSGPSSDDINISANGERAIFFCNVANVTMDLNEVETITLMRSAAPPLWHRQGGVHRFRLP